VPRLQPRGRAKGARTAEVRRFYVRDRSNLSRMQESENDGYKSRVCHLPIALSNQVSLHGAAMVDECCSQIGIDSAPVRQSTACREHCWQIPITNERQRKVKLIGHLCLRTTSASFLAAALIVPYVYSVLRKVHILRKIGSAGRKL
jgi:hypothetical protein